MKNHFSMRRFSLLFRKHTAEHLKSYAMSLGVLIGAMFLILGWIAYMSTRPIDIEMQNIFFGFALMGAGTVFTSTVFANLGDKSQAISTLMLPASQLEKYLVGWLYSFGLFLVLFTGSFYLVTSIVLGLDPQPGQLINIFTDKKFILSMLAIYALLHGVAIWGAITFEKLAFIKTAFGFFILLVVLVILNSNVLEWMFNLELNSAIPFGQVSFYDKDQIYYFIRLPEGEENLIGLFPIAMAVFLWLAAYMRLKEKQI